MKENENTEYGTQYGFSSIQDTNEFLQRHPLTRYAHYRPYIDRMVSGEKRILSDKDPIIFAVTSGTSGNASVLPFVMNQRKIFFIEGISLVYNCLTRAFPGSAYLRKDFKVFYNPTWRFSADGIRIGPNSSTPDDSKSMLFMYSTPEPVFKITSEPEALYCHLLFALKDAKIGMIEANFASLIYYAFKSLETELPKLIEVSKGILF